MKIITILTLKTNYIWVIYNQLNECIIVDPGEFVQVLKILNKLKLILKAILLTHNHHDHINGIYELIKHFPNVQIYGPIDILNTGTKLVTVSDKDEFFLLNKKVMVIGLPGHTLNHIGFYYNSWLFTGDTLFSAGCGKVQTGLIRHMYQSFLKIQCFPENTELYPGHEYTLSNLNFALSILPEDPEIVKYNKKITTLHRRQQRIFAPMTLALELKINLFFRCNNNNKNLKYALNCFPKTGKEWKIFRNLRNKKDLYP
ncbi:hydroxyacylglutathione hydrolase [Candidatus Blochmanniella vafra str. BVAF]|uniref:Hydroxyacylglutathione hydrolase n=1 Tax=Blochmanniella vafra (strain BVAF) TaxID=859654 RepID=E8Q608_BLOVB|nr:hydroxyacylglutathione hydrolase [Candidatus Blochmannia vafer]ADV33624.1 hydroxyacylglutathione hydrolase [Candidatus Blochmannia vafer str. BVAF]